MDKKALIISILTIIFVTFMYVLFLAKPLYFIIILIICSILAISFLIYYLITIGD